MKKNMLILAVIALLIPAFAFATGSGDSGEDITSISGMFDRILYEDDGQDEWAEAFKELTGVELKITRPEHNQYPDILSTTFMSGDLPDVAEIQTNDYIPYAKSGLIIPLDEYIKASKELKSVPSDLLEAYRLKDGHIYGIPTYSGGGCVAYIRNDWLKAVGMSAPKTWDELVEVLKAFTYGDPDKNGVDDTVGITLPMSTAYEFDYYNRLIMQDAFFGFDQKNGVWVDGFLEPSMIGALERFAYLYKEGLLDPEFFTNKTSVARTKIIEGQAGIMEYWSGVWATRFDERSKNAIPSSEIIPINPIKGSYYISRVGPCFAITKDAKNPAQVFDVFINTQHDKGAGQALFTFGVEGIHYEKTDSGYKPLPTLSNPDVPFTKAYSDPTLIMNDWDPIIPMLPLEKLSREINNDPANVRYLSLPEGGDVYSKRVGEILTLKQEIFSAAVVGEMTPEAAIALYTKKVKALDIDKVLAELND